MDTPPRLYISRMDGRTSPPLRQRTAPDLCSLFSRRYRPSVESTARASPLKRRDNSEAIATEPDAFRWTDLWVIGGYIYPRIPSKAKEFLGPLNVGHPTVTATNGLLCIGTDRGIVLVFDFQQRFKCTCGDEGSGV